MDDKILLALVATASAIVGGLLTAVISPWIKHKLEQSTRDATRKREQVQSWRAMIVQIASQCDNDSSANSALQVHPDYLSLEPLLKEETRRSVYKRNFVVTSGQSLPYALEQVKRGIAEIEKQWGLNE